MVKKDFMLERGDIVWVNFSPTIGHKQSGLRPAVVISPSKYNSFSNLVLVCPVTKKSKGYFFEVKITGLKEDSFVLADQLRSIDNKERIKKRTGKISQDEILEILARMSLLFQ